MRKPSKQEFIDLEDKKPTPREDVEVLFDCGNTRLAYRHFSKIRGEEIWVDSKTGCLIKYAKPVAWREKWKRFSY